MKHSADREEVAFSVILPDAHFPRGEATTIAPPGLPLQRLQYLYRSIREYVNEPYQDIVCPLPPVMPTAESEDETQPTDNRRQATATRGRGRKRKNSS